VLNKDEFRGILEEFLLLLFSIGYNLLRSELERMPPMLSKRLL
jgi:hypothetical protein